LDSAEGGAFGFLDPSEVIRGAHLIPAFHYGRTPNLLPKSIARRPDQNDQDFFYYYVNCFVDRDMFMRYCDNAVGHRTTASSQNSSPGKSAEPEDADDDDMDVDSDGPTPPEENEDLPAEGPEADGEVDDSDLESSDSEDEVEVEGENGEGTEEGEDGAAGDEEDNEDIIDSFGYDEL